MCGHTRFKAAKKLGIKTIPVKYADELTDDEIKAYRLADNKTAEFAEWDFDLLSEELKGINDIDMEQFGFAFDEDDQDTQVVEDNYECDLPTQPKAKQGDIYKLGRHRLMCGDATKIDNIKKLMDGKIADLYLTDPPYNVSYEGKTKEKLTIQNDAKEQEEFREFLTEAFLNAYSVMKPGAAFYIWHAILESKNFIIACDNSGLKVKEILIWNKNHFTFGRQDYQWKHEPCLYGWKEGAAHYWGSDRKQTTVLEFERPLRNDIHPTMKPVNLFDYLIKNSSKVNDIVLDTFGGSGTTLIACEQNKRCCYMVELDPKYTDAIIKRWEDFTGEKAVLIEGG